MVPRPPAGAARQDVSELRTLVVRRAMRCHLVRVARRLTCTQPLPEYWRRAGRSPAAVSLGECVVLEPGVLGVGHERRRQSS